MKKTIITLLTVCEIHSDSAYCKCRTKRKRIKTIIS